MCEERIKSIETEYKGIKFRSKLEARWAVFFDQCGVEWEYEPKPFNLGDGIWYLPDFLLHNVPSGEVSDTDHIEWSKNGKVGIDPADISQRSIYKDLWVEVKGVMDKDSAVKINKFAKKISNQIIVVGDIPEDDFFEQAQYDLENKSNHECYFNQVKPDRCCGFADCLGKDETGTLGVYGTFKWDSRVGLDTYGTEKAYKIARNYKFDHRLGEK